MTKKSSNFNVKAALQKFPLFSYAFLLLFLFHVPRNQFRKINMLYVRPTPLIIKFTTKSLRCPNIIWICCSPLSHTQQKKVNIDGVGLKLSGFVMKCRKPIFSERRPNYPLSPASPQNRCKIKRNWYWFFYLPNPNVERLSLENLNDFFKYFPLG